MIKNISDTGLKLIKSFEGFRSKAYYDSVGVVTIGYGSTNAMSDIMGRTININSTCTEVEASNWLRQAIDKKYGTKVLKYDSKYHWTQNEYDALCSFCYNIGSIEGLTANGTRTKSEISEKFLSYNKAGGKVLAGLTTRRQKERDLFIRSDSVTTVSHNKYYDKPVITLIDALKLSGETDTTYKHRKDIATVNGIVNYSGTAEQNTKLLNLLMEGKLKRY